MRSGSAVDLYGRIHLARNADLPPGLRGMGHRTRLAFEKQGQEGIAMKHRGDRRALVVSVALFLVVTAVAATVAL